MDESSKPSWRSSTTLQRSWAVPCPSWPWVRLCCPALWPKRKETFSCCRTTFWALTWPQVLLLFACSLVFKKRRSELCPVGNIKPWTADWKPRGHPGRDVHTAVLNVIISKRSSLQTMQMSSFNVTFLVGLDQFDCPISSGNASKFEPHNVTKSHSV